MSKRVTKICKNCGKKFVRKSNSQKYCSVSCRKKPAKYVGKTKKRISENGKISYATLWRAVANGLHDDIETCLNCEYDNCSGICEKLKDGIWEKLDYPSRQKCKWCGREFEPSKLGGKYCSKKCYSKDYYQKKRKKTTRHSSASLDAPAKEASDAGLTYGKYIAKEYVESMQKYARTGVNKMTENELKDDLISTLKTYADCDMNISKTAKKMFYARNTIIVRLDQIYRITGKNPKKFHELNTLLQIYG